MSGSTENVKPVARAICEKVLARDGKSDEKLAAEVDTYWHIVAVELEPGILDKTGEYMGKLEWTRKIDVYRDWMRPHPERREAWKIKRFGTLLPRQRFVRRPGRAVQSGAGCVGFDVAVGTRGTPVIGCSGTR